jgi:hypothetical protein
MGTLDVIIIDSLIRGKHILSVATNDESLAENLFRRAENRMTPDKVRKQPND